MKTTPQNEKMDLIFIMDRSGSMMGSQKDTIGGFNSFIQQEIKKELDTRVTTVLFDNEYEILYRKLLKYPPICDILCISISSSDEKLMSETMEAVAEEVKKYIIDNKDENEILECIGPSQAPIYRINSVYKEVLYIKSDKKMRLSRLMGRLNDWITRNEKSIVNVEIQYDFNSM